MISGNVTKFFAATLAAVFFFSLSVQSASASELEALMQEMEKVSQRTVRYKETKQMEIFDAPLYSEGTLEYRAPDTLIRTVSSPSWARYTIDGKQVKIEKGGKLRIRNLDQMPLVSIFVESFRATLAGRLDRLNEFYRIKFSGSRSKWTISLWPKNRKLASYVNRLQISGTADWIEQYVIEDSNGDLTQMELFAAAENEAGATH